MSFQESLALLTILARRLRGNPQYMAYVLAAFQSRENLTDAELAQELGTLPELVVRLSLCKRPSPSSPQFAEQVRELADYTLTDAGRLANILRRVDGLERLSQRASGLALQAEGKESGGILAAARDRIDSTDDGPPSGEEESPEE
ncbi:MAG TPA: hypothetical protein VD861_17200 [Pyrinomonadaceae bacterium]|nr:hypothetical protein [Pyrinomonadaceae bacterium]